MDIGCGKGGDLRKYKIGKIRHLICTDIADTTLSQAEERYKEMQSFSQGGRNNHNSRGGWNQRGHQNRPPDLFSAEFIYADSTKDCLKDKFRDPNIKIDMVCAHFSFHYSFESLPQVERMLQNISDNLVDGGYFIGTTVDANEVMRRVRESDQPKKYKCPSQDNEKGEGDQEIENNETDGSDKKYGHFGNEIYSITFKDGILKSDEPPPLFGAEYNFHLEEVVDCPEFLVNFPCLEKLAARYGLKLVYKQRFDQFYHRMKVSNDGDGLLRRMKALERYPDFHGTQIGTAPDDYTHAQIELERIMESDRSDRANDRSDRIPINTSLGTLSKSEWEAITLYLVFVFQKKSTNDGQEAERQDNKRPRTN